MGPAPHCAKRTEGRRKLFELLRHQTPQAVEAPRPRHLAETQDARVDVHPALPGFLKRPAQVAKPNWILAAEDSFKFKPVVSDAVETLYGKRMP